LDSECTDPDTCDGAGTCLPNHANSGASCGDIDIPCHIDDTCDGGGNCFDNGYSAPGTPCGEDGIFCNGVETCNGSGACYSPGDPCPPQYCDEINDVCVDFADCTIGDDFEDGVVGNWQKYDAGDSITVVDGGANGTTKSLRYVDSGDGSYIWKEYFQTVAQVESVSLFVRAQGGGNPTFHIRVADASGNRGVDIRITWSSGQVEYFNGSSYIPFTTVNISTFHKFEFRFNWIDKLVDIYIDDSLQVSSAAFANVMFAGMNKLNVPGGWGNTVYIDEIAISYQSDAIILFQDDFEDNDYSGRWIVKNTTWEESGGVMTATSGCQGCVYCPEGPALLRSASTIPVGAGGFSLEYDFLMDNSSAGHSSMWVVLHNAAEEIGWDSCSITGTWDRNFGVITNTYQAADRITVMYNRESYIQEPPMILISLNEWHHVSAEFDLTNGYTVEVTRISDSTVIFAETNSTVDCTPPADVTDFYVQLEAEDAGFAFDNVVVKGLGCVNSRVDWVEVPGGAFMMGSDSGDPDEQPVHLVTVPAFKMTKTEVTVAQYQACVDSGVCNEPGTGGQCNWGVGGHEKHPANCVSWDKAVTFCQWLGGRLPSEAEWEYAARSGGQAYTYPWGDNSPSCTYAIMDDGGCGCGGNMTWPVCSKLPGNTEQGLCDMGGNVWEWIQDWYHSSYDGAPADGSAWEDPIGSIRLTRGSGFCASNMTLRNTERSDGTPLSGGAGTGFRCARDLIYGNIIYEEDFSSDPGFSSDYTPGGGEFFTWDQVNDIYKVRILDANDVWKYAYSPSFQSISNSSFSVSLDFVVRESSFGQGMKIRFFYSGNGYTVRSFEIKIPGSQNMTMHLVDSIADVYTSPNFQYDIWYSVLIEYDYGSGTTEFRVIERQSENVLCHERGIPFNLGEFDSIAMGDNVVNGEGSYAEMHLDNIEIALPFKVWSSSP
jgi:formylglycine-generating enzyme required for sulfatase activity